MKKVLLTCVCLILTFTVITALAINASASGSYVKFDGFTFEQSGNNEITLVGWDDRSDYLEIPEAILDNRVVAIDDTAFMDDKIITSVNFTYARSLRRIGKMAFKGCIGLAETLVVPANITTIDTGAFQECISLQGIEYYADNAPIPSQCFYGCSSLSEVHLTNGVSSIGSLAFANCPNLTSIRIPSSVFEIGSNAFSNCPKIVISCYYDSYAHHYAEKSGIKFELIDPQNVPTEPETQPETEPETQPETQPETTQPVEVTYLLGDADGDGDVNILDATKIQRVLVDLDPDEDGMIALRGNVNNAPDGLNILHATKIQRWIAGFVTEEPIGTSVTVTI